MTDWELVNQVKKGNRDSYALLVDRYKKVIFNLAYRFTHDYTEAEDLSQEIFLKVYIRIDDFKNSAKFFTWLYRVAVNKCIDYQRKSKKVLPPMEIKEEINKSNEKDPEECILKKEKVNWVQNAVNSLAEKYKVVIILHHFQGLSYKEISEVLKIPLKTVETRIYRAKKLLKEKLSSEEGGNSGLGRDGNVIKLPRS